MDDSWRLRYATAVMRMIAKHLSILACAALAACTLPQKALPEAAARRPQPFVIAANPLAAQAGIEVLKRGGSAVDAAVAVQAMLTLVEPQSSGIGGGAFIHFYNGTERSTIVYDGRETAPTQANGTMFLGADGKPLRFDTAVVSGRATGVPGAVKLLEQAHGEHGILPWSGLFDDAERTARDGFLVSPRLARFIGSDYPQAKTHDTRAYFRRPDGTPMQAGDRLRNPAYADFLRRLAAEGSPAFYAGATAAKIVARTRAGLRRGTGWSDRRAGRCAALCRQPRRRARRCAGPDARACRDVALHRRRRTRQRGVDDRDRRIPVRLGPDG